MTLRSIHFIALDEMEQQEAIWEDTHIDEIFCVSIAMDK
jgi:hypothetical protein